LAANFLRKSKRSKELGVLRGKSQDFVWEKEEPCGKFLTLGLESGEETHYLGGGFKDFLLSLLLGEMIQFD